MELLTPRNSLSVSVHSLAFFQPTAVIAVARYHGAAMTYSSLTEDLESFVEYRTQHWKDRSATNAASFMVLHLGL